MMDKKNEMCSGNPVSAKSLSLGKAKGNRGKGISRLSAPVDREIQEPIANPGDRHGESDR